MCEDRESVVEFPLDRYQCQLVLVPLEFGQAVRLVASPLSAQLGVRPVEVFSEARGRLCRLPEQGEAQPEGLVVWSSLWHNRRSQRSDRNQVGKMSITVMIL